MRRSQRLRLVATPILLSLIGVLVVLNLEQRGIFTLRWFTQNKDAIGAIGTTVTTTVAIIAACLAYFRFFRGRTFVARAQIELKVAVYDDPTGMRLHSIRVEVTNLNSQVIWSPRVLVLIDCLNADGTKSQVWVDSWKPIAQRTAISNSPSDVENIHFGETSTYFTECAISPKVWLTTYTATVSLANGRSWTEYVAIENKPSKP